MDGFNTRPGNTRCAPSNLYVYQYVKPAQVRPYWSMAQQYVLNDDMFPTQGSEVHRASRSYPRRHGDQLDVSVDRLSVGRRGAAVGLRLHSRLDDVVDHRRQSMAAVSQRRAIPVLNVRDGTRYARRRGLLYRGVTTRRPSGKASAAICGTRSTRSKQCATDRNGRPTSSLRKRKFLPTSDATRCRRFHMSFPFPKLRSSRGLERHRPVVGCRRRQSHW